MKLNIKKILGILAILIILLLLFFLLKNNKQDIERIKNIPASLLSILFMLTLIEFFLNGYMLKILLEPFNITTRFKEWFGLASITTLGNYLTFFRGGTATKAVYLKNRYNLSYISFLASVGASYVITVFVYSILGVLFSIIMLFYSQIFNLTLFLLFIFIFLAALFAIIFFPKLPATENKILRQIYNIIHGWNTLRKNTHFILHFSLFVFLLYLVSASKIYLLYKSLAYDITISSAAFLTLLSNLSIFISFTPAGLGIREAVLALTSSLLDLGLSSGIYVSALERAITIILIVIIGPIFSYLLIKKPTHPS